MSAKPLFRVVAGLDFSAARDEKRSLAQARARARPILREWLRRVEHHVLAGKLGPLDLMMAKELTNYPSANEGRCYAGQERLGAAVGKCARTARSSLKRLCQAGLLTSKRGGPGRTSSWMLCINAKPIFGNTDAEAERQFSDQDRKQVAGLDRKQVADKPSEPDPIEHKPSPQPPAAQAEMPQAVRLKEGEAERVLHGDVLGPEGEPTFEEFWKAIRHNPGPSGPALVAWRKLSADDRRSIGNQLGPYGLDLEGTWACTWLVARRWTAPSLRPKMDGGCAPVAARQPFELRPYTPEWTVERDRKRAAGEPTKLMETWAKEGKSWWCYRTISDHV